MVSSDDLFDMLAAWEEARRQGRDVPPEELCGERPELLEDLREAIASLKMTDWMDRPLGDPATAICGPSPTDRPTSPLQLGEYTLLEQIGSGGMGRVFKALHRRMDRVVAVKLLPPALAATTQAVERFRQEVRVAASLVHANVVQAYDAGEQDGQPYLVTEFIDGMDLARLVRQRGPLPVAQAIDYVLQAAAGLGYAHAKTVVHKDIKPANLMVTPDGVVKVLDLGLATTRPAVVAGEGQAPLAGSVDYLPPEQADPSAIPDHRADQYSLGCTLFFLLTGRVVFPAVSVLEKLKAHREQQPPSPRRERTEVPARLDAVVRKMLAKRVEDRYQSMEEVRQALKRAVRQGWRGMTWLGIVLCSVLLVAGIVIWAAWKPKVTTPPVGTAEPSEAKAPTPTVVQQDAAIREVYRVQAHKGPVRCLVFSSDGTSLFTGGSDHKVVWHDFKAGKVLATLSQPQTPTALVVTPKRDRLFVGTSTGQVRLWTLDPENPKEVVAVPCHASAITSMAVADDGSFLVTGNDKEAVLWDWSGERPRTARLPQTGGPVLDVRFVPGKTEFITCVGLGKDKHVEVWRWSVNLLGNKPVQPLGVARPRESVNAAAFVMNEKIMAAAVGSEVYAWEFASGQALGVYQGHAKPIRYLATGKDGDMVISADVDKVQSWNSRKLHRRWEFDIPAVTGLGISPDGRRVAVGTGDGEVVVLGPR